MSLKCFPIRTYFQEKNKTKCGNKKKKSYQNEIKTLKLLIFISKTKTKKKMPAVSQNVR